MKTKASKAWKTGKRNVPESIIRRLTAASVAARKRRKAERGGERTYFSLRLDLYRRLAEFPSLDKQRIASEAVRHILKH